ncbi:OLC1v1023308C4 [Oldenlandia corymbosa var. corymbosa]|uniref:non-specific serine/threonine protein kinase n=1 Tax=Oldenlandia corymbosa var. corymbosa TaxID=529605 RepID=A0AAV1C219_OLDCO|nr:OLC1v1023308C4 [Oldenlandia corymbosa var. corymbosa]
MVAGGAEYSELRICRGNCRQNSLANNDLSWNYLNGTIPREWGSLRLTNISILGNRISGPIPKELGKISTLLDLTLEQNQLNGSIPPELGDLPKLEKFRISDNRLEGIIPSFIANWTHLEILIVQASGLKGPIPSVISSLSNVTDLRISDLNGNGATFPLLSGAKYLNTLDLSFNNLIGPVPDSYKYLSGTDSIFLTGNFLSGQVPGWMLERGDNIDLSYNNFTGSGATLNCLLRKKNLFGSSSRGSTTGLVSCLSSFQCPTTVYSLHINCGGGEVKLENGIFYEEDISSEGPSSFVKSRCSWGYSSTGQFLDDNDDSDTYIWNTSRAAEKNQDITYASLGRRFFDIFIQGKLLKKDFNIDDEAGGVNKPVVRNFSSVVSDNTLEIRFYWAGKGTTSIPVGGVYGPLISAISVLLFGGKGVGETKVHLKVGHLGDGTIIAVKQLSSRSNQGNREFVNEIGIISDLQHPNLVKLYGCCIEGNQLLLIYEYMENNSLARALFGPEEHQLQLDWPMRHKIYIGIARALAYLHEESRLKIVHRDIKTTNVLLDKDLNPKISDFGLAKLSEENTHICTRVAGTLGYMAPEYALRGYLTDKADVYSFGVVLLEIVSGRSSTSIKPKQDFFIFLTGFCKMDFVATTHEP